MDFLSFRFAWLRLLCFLLRPKSLRRLNGQGIRRAVIIGDGARWDTSSRPMACSTPRRRYRLLITGFNVVLTRLSPGCFCANTSARPLAGRGRGYTGLALITSTAGAWFRRASSHWLRPLLCPAHCGLGRWSSSYDTYAHTVLQLATVTVLCFYSGSPQRHHPAADGACGGLSSSPPCGYGTASWCKPGRSHWCRPPAWEWS